MVFSFGANKIKLSAQIKTDSDPYDCDWVYLMCFVERFCPLLKGIVHPELKFNPFVTHPYVDGGSGEILHNQVWWSGCLQ